jgi:uncharacterized protein
MTSPFPTFVLLADADLGDWGPVAEATRGPMRERSVTMWSDGDQEAGVWECTAGTAYYVQEQHEVVQILAGRVTVTPDGGPASVLGPGDSAAFPRGWAGTWEISETLRKLYVVF